MQQLFFYEHPHPPPRSGEPSPIVGEGGKMSEPTGEHILTDEGGAARLLQFEFAGGFLVNRLPPARAIDNRPYDRIRRSVRFCRKPVDNRLPPAGMSRTPSPTSWQPVFGAFVGGGVPDAPNRSMFSPKTSRERTDSRICHCEPVRTLVGDRRSPLR